MGNNEGAKPEGEGDGQRRPRKKVRFAGLRLGWAQRERWLPATKRSREESGTRACTKGWVGQLGHLDRLTRTSIRYNLDTNCSPKGLDG